MRAGGRRNHGGVTSWRTPDFIKQLVTSPSGKDACLSVYTGSAFSEVNTMDKLRFGLSVAVVCALSSGFNPPVSAQSGRFFTMKSKASDRCLHVKNGDKPVGAAIEVFDPCQTTADFRVERMEGEILRIKATPKNFWCLQVKQPFRGQDLPVRVTAGNCVAPVSNWSVGFPEADGFRRVILRREEPEAAVCLQERPKSSELVVDLCNESSRWKFETVSPP